MRNTLDNLTIGEARQIAALFSDKISGTAPSDPLIGRYVIVRCRDAGVHAGILESRSGRECTLIESRRLWYWRPAQGKWLSAVANHGLHSDSKLGEPVERITLTENCELILCSPKAEESIKGAKSE